VRVGLLILFTLAVSAVQTPRTSKLPDFQDYPVSITFTGVPAEVSMATAGARRFSTELRRQAAQGPNFAGHYTLARWGCGAGCVVGAIIDSRTGQVWFPGIRAESRSTPTALVNHGSDFRIDSELIMLTGVINEGDAGNAYYRWHDNTLSLLRFDRFSARLSR
jgi:hypothetical protein